RWPAGVIRSFCSFYFVHSVRCPALRAAARERHGPGFLDGAGPAAIGGIAGSAVPLGLALGDAWQVAVLALAAAWLVGARRGVVSALSGAAGLGVLAVLLRWQ